MSAGDRGSNGVLVRKQEPGEVSPPGAVCPDALSQAQGPRAASALPGFLSEAWEKAQ